MKVALKGFKREKKKNSLIFYLGPRQEGRRNEGTSRQKMQEKKEGRHAPEGLRIRLASSFDETPIGTGGKRGDMFRSLPERGIRRKRICL